MVFDEQGFLIIEHGNFMNTQLDGLSQTQIIPGTLQKVEGYNY